MSRRPAVHKALQAFADARRPLYSPSELDAILAAIAKPRKTSFRINTLLAPDAASHKRILAEVRQLLDRLQQRNKAPLRIRPAGPWSRLAFQVSDPSVKAKQLMDLECHRNGLIHFQSLSSMLPPLCFAPIAGQGGPLVLDMCSAPGGKSTQLVEQVFGPTSASTGADLHQLSAGRVVANEVNPLRFQRLERNLKTLVPRGVASRVHATLCDGRRLSIAAPAASLDDPVAMPDRDEQTTATAISRGVFPRQFDAVLLDAPCSGEGVFSVLEPHSFSSWSPEYVSKLQRLQRQLLDRAFSLLRPGGQLIYSTCTLAPEENEHNVEWIVGQHPSLEVVDLHLDLLDPLVNGGQAAFRPAGGPGFCSTNTSIPLHKALRVLPTQDYEGFFAVRFIKRQ
ncbi:S-adenosyl-L-methionine-dependent methyltransferase [Entophlyctis helioformis]|nr:S-adenosyl-L-methionine-dependent methyltransferase [Entophlyctis helioformis]